MTYYTVTDAYTDVHEVLVYLTIDGEELTTTPEHLFLQADGAWTPAGRLAVGDEIRNADGEYGIVEVKEFAATPQVMYNMTVADVHLHDCEEGDDESNSKERMRDIPMFITVAGVYRNGKVELLEVPASLAADENGERQVLVTFLSPPAIDLQARGITEAQAAELRTRLASFAEDWNDAAMDLYDQYELNHATLARGRAD